MDNLKELGVQENELNELASIEKAAPKGNPDRKSKIMGWLGKVTETMVTRGIYDNIPTIIEYVGNLI